MICPIGEKCSKEGNMLTCYPCVVKKCNMLKEAAYKKIVADKLRRFSYESFLSNFSYSTNSQYNNWNKTTTTTN